MTTFKTEISRAERRKDGTWNVKIRITHRRKVRRYSTQMYATDKDVTRSGKLKNQIIIDNTEATIREWRGRLNTLGSRADTMDVDEIVAYITSPPEGEGIPMFPWMEKYAEKIPKKATRGNYLWAIRSLRNYIGMDINFQQLKIRTLMNYIDTLGMEKVKEYLIYNYIQEHPGTSEAEAAKVLRLEDFSFYSARHSWATIARNDLRIDKWTIHEGLNHVDMATKITDVYIKRDFTRINEANFKVIEYVFMGVANSATTTPK